MAVTTHPSLLFPQFRSAQSCCRFQRQFRNWRSAWSFRSALTSDHVGRVIISLHLVGVRPGGMASPTASPAERSSSSVRARRTS